MALTSFTSLTALMSYPWRCSHCKFYAHTTRQRDILYNKLYSFWLGIPHSKRLDVTQHNSKA